jgi:cell division protein FtsB
MGKKGFIKIYIAAAVLGAIFLPSFFKYCELRSQNRSLKERMDELKTENRRLSDEVRRLKTDPVYVELKAREKMGLARKGEIICKE